MGGAEMGLGIGLALASTSRTLGGSIVALLLVGASFGSVMYFFVYRKQLNRAVADPGAPRTADREPLRRTLGRTLLSELWMLAILGVIVALNDTADVAGGLLAGGILAGNGAALLVNSKKLRSWERAHCRVLLRDPRWRWTPDRSGKWGQGLLDRRDFYSEAAGGSSTGSSSAVR